MTDKAMISELAKFLRGNLTRGNGEFVEENASKPDDGMRCVVAASFLDKMVNEKTNTKSFVDIWLGVFLGVIFTLAIVFSIGPYFNDWPFDISPPIEIK